MVVSYTLYIIVSIALSLTIRQQLAIECLRRWNQQVMNMGDQNLRVFSAENTPLTNREIVFEDFQS